MLTEKALYKDNRKFQCFKRSLANNFKAFTLAIICNIRFVGVVHIAKFDTNCKPLFRLKR